MSDIEKAIKDLEEIKEYIRETAKDIASRKCRMLDKVNDALALLKEQDAEMKDGQKKVEFIESYIKIGDGDYKWNDNHGELVRCKDCKYWRQNTEFCGRWSVANVAQRTPPDWFCADGRRR